MAHSSILFIFLYFLLVAALLDKTKLRVKGNRPDKNNSIKNKSQFYLALALFFMFIIMSVTGIFACYSFSNLIPEGWSINCCDASPCDGPIIIYETLLIWVTALAYWFFVYKRRLSLILIFATIATITIVGILLTYTPSNEPYHYGPANEAASASIVSLFLIIPSLLNGFITYASRCYASKSYTLIYVLSPFILFILPLDSLFDWLFQSDAEIIMSNVYSTFFATHLLVCLQAKIRYNRQAISKP